MSQVPSLHQAVEDTGSDVAAASRRNSHQRYQRVLRWVLQSSDLVLVDLAFVLAYYLRYIQGIGGDVADENFVPLDVYYPLLIGLSITLVVVYRVTGLYRAPLKGPFLREVWSIVLSTTFGITLLFAGVYLFRGFAYSRGLFLIASVLTTALLVGSRIVARAVQGELRRRGVGVERTLVVGGDRLGLTVMHVLATEPGLGYYLVGFLHESARINLGRFTCLGLISDLPDVLRQAQVDTVIVTLPATSESRQVLAGVTQTCEQADVQVRVVPDLFELSLSLSPVDVEDLRGIPVIGLRKTTISGYNLMLKRAMDIVVAGLTLAILSPLWLLIAAAVKLDSPGSIYFAQTRLGKDRRPFTALKFRSMYVDAEARLAELTAQNEATGPLFKMRDDPRVTRVGRWLRRTSLDELTQLWNVLRGEMSLVGPRPPLPSEVEQYQEWHLKRLAVAPGMTGLWQVTGRSEIPFEEMVLSDLYYIENWSLGLDFQILLRTIPAVLTGRGAF